MTEFQAAALCRITVRAPDRVVDLAVPSDVPVADLLPTVVGYAADRLDEAGMDHGGWVLQRLGGAPLADDATLESCGLRHGETLYLRPRADTLPEVRTDDLVDSIADALVERPDAWTPGVSRALLHGLAMAALAAGVVTLAMPGGPPWLRAAAATGAGLLVLAAAATASRAVGDAAAGTALGMMVAPHLALAGWLVPGGALDGPGAHQVLGARLLAACVAGAGGAVLALACVGIYPAIYIAATVVAGAGALGGLMLMAARLEPGQAAGLVAVVTVLFGAFVPALSFRLAGLRMPPLPSNAQQLQEYVEPHSPSAVAERAILADGWMTAFYCAVAAVSVPCVASLLTSPALAEILTALALSVLLVLHGRGLGNRWQRLALTLPGALGFGLLALDTARATFSERLALTAGFLAVAVCLAVASWTVPGRRVLPYWGRAAELLHSVAAICVLPLCLWSLGVFGALRALAG